MILFSVSARNVDGFSVWCCSSVCGSVAVGSSMSDVLGRVALMHSFSSMVTVGDVSSCGPPGCYLGSLCVVRNVEYWLVGCAPLVSLRLFDQYVVAWK